MPDAENNYVDLFENAPCGYLLIAADGRIIEVNTTFCNWTGFEKEAVVGKRFRELLKVAGRIFYETHFAPLLRMQGFFDEVALDIVASDGQSLAVLANALERRASDGTHLDTRVTLFRATERRRFERGLVDAHEALDAANRELQLGLDTAQHTGELREQFIAVLGHDLRNPLASISAGTHILARNNSDEKTAKVLRLMLASVSRMSGLIDNVLDFARGRLGGGLELTRDHGRPILPALTQVIDEIRASFPEREIDTTFDLEGSIEADHARIAQLFSNLMGNAITHGDPKTAVRVSAVIAGGAFELSVSNGGNPISKAAMERLFQPFYRGDAKGRQGLGLGLYIASEIAQAHGGRIDVVSDRDRTVFTFRMPAIQFIDPALMEQSSAEIVGSGGGGALRFPQADAVEYSANSSPHPSPEDL